jgi:hypothetical protein
LRRRWLTNVGSQYLMGFLDADKNPFDGARTYKVTLPKDIPAARFWSFTVYDNQTRSMLQTPQRYPRAGSQTYPSPAAVANADGSTTVYFGPTKPADAKAGNWIQTTPAWQGLVHGPAFLQPARIVLRQELETKRDRVGDVSTIKSWAKTTTGTDHETHIPPERYHRCRRTRAHRHHNDGLHADAAANASADAGADADAR